MLKLENVRKTYRSGNGSEVRAVRGINLSIAPGEFIALRGPSGCGKTTLLLMAGGLLAPDQGRITLDDQDPYQLAANDRARFRASHIGFVFQQFHLIPYLNVLDNVLAPSLACDRQGNGLKSDAMDLLKHFGMDARVKHRPAELSTGERQRTALARALLNKPKFLMADEPTGNLDPENADAVLAFIQEFAADGGGVLLVTHEDRALQAAQQVREIKEGHLVGEE